MRSLGKAEILFTTGEKFGFPEQPEWQGENEERCLCGQGRGSKLTEACVVGSVSLNFP